MNLRSLFLYTSYNFNRADKINFFVLLSTLSNLIITVLNVHIRIPIFVPTLFNLVNLWNDEFSIYNSEFDARTLIGYFSRMYGF